MSMIKALRTLAALENGTLNAAQLETQLATQARKDELRMLLATRSLFARIAASKNTCDALVGSATALAILTNPLPYQSDLFSALFKTPSWKMALHASDSALNIVVSSATLIAFARAASGYSTFTGTASGTTPVSLAVWMPGAAYILLGLGTVGYVSGTTITTKRSGSGISNTVSASTATANAVGNSLAVPLAAPYSFVKGSVDIAVHYFGVLRCDI